jgi:hypothetical protein
MGTPWSRQIEWFREENNANGFKYNGDCPCCVEVYRNREYAAAIKLIIAMRAEEIKEYDRILVRRIISPIKFIEGGAAMLAAENINHQKDIAGNNIIMPFVMNILRVCVVSYVILASANIQDEHSPCANIMVSAPCQPHEVLDITPAVTIPMWLTDE